MTDYRAELLSETEKETNPIPFAEFLEGTAPGNMTSVTDVSKYNTGLSRHELVTPGLQLYCGSDSCNGTRFFRSPSPSVPLKGSLPHNIFIFYQCSNCRTTRKLFSLSLSRHTNTTSGKCYKFGELPKYGPPTPARLIKLIGPDRDIFIKGRICENQGLGVGAFAYYRRVVENQKNRIISEIITVANKLNAPAEAIQKLEAAKVETQFSKALGDVKDTIPQVLLINGHNPLRLLHSALSDGLHGRNDAECLERASSIRVVLAELSERLSQALKDDAELHRALSHLMKPQEDEDATI